MPALVARVSISRGVGDLRKEVAVRVAARISGKGHMWEGCTQTEGVFELRAVLELAIHIME